MYDDTFLLLIDYPDYPQYNTGPNYDQSSVKYEEDEKKFDPDNTNGNNSRQYDDDYEEGEAY